MKFTKIFDQWLEIIAENRSLAQYLSNMNKGREATPHSWLAERETSEQTLGKWLKILYPSNAGPFQDLFNQFDSKQIEKFGPQGKVPPVLSKDALEALNPLVSPSEYDDEDALSQYFEKADEFGNWLFGSKTKRMMPRGFDRVVDDMTARDTLSSNSGAWRFTRRQLVKDLEIQDANSGVAYDLPGILLFRQYNGKLRPVIMFPMSMNLLEFQYTQVLQDELRRSNKFVTTWLSPWLGYEDVKSSLTVMWHGENILGGDTTKMDAHMRRAQIKLFWRITRWLFQEKYWETWLRICLHVNDIPIIVNDKYMLTGYKGLSSGSGLTQITETVLILFLGWLKQVKAGMGIGDDFVMLDDATAEMLVAWLAELGLPANPQKQSVSKTEVTFLQRLNVQGFFSREQKDILGGYYPTIRALNSSLNPEKFHNPKKWNSDMFCIRQYMILENCVDDPCFEQFVRFVTKRSRYLIPFAKKKDSILNRIQKESRSVTGLNPSYNQEKRTKPLSSFVSIKLARTL